MSTGVRDARPPRAVLRLLNPIVKALLRTRASRAIPQIALLEFCGRRSGRRLSVVVGWHALHNARVVFTPAPWRWNFAGGAAASVRWRGRDEDHVGTLELDPATVARAIDVVLRAGTSPRALGLRVSAGHTVTAGDVLRTRRAMVLFRPASQDSRR
ncbi:MAG: hypothetical protein ABJA86_09530 [Nocardioidaceae bacterium]